METYDVSERWIKEKPLYDEIGKGVVEVLSAALKNEGIFAKVTSRTKEMDSLVKKIVRKKSSYEEIHDKVGVRIVIHFKDQLSIVDSLICQILNGEI